MIAVRDEYVIDHKKIDKLLTDILKCNLLVENK